MPESCQIRNPKLQMASYKSGVNRDVKYMLNGKDNPGVGNYNVNEFKSFGVNKLEGGGAPNNFTLCYKDMNPCIRRVETIPSPRILDPSITSKSSSICSLIFFLKAPNEVGPGSYMKDQAEKKILEKFKPPKMPKRETNWASSDRFASPTEANMERPGPGQYKDMSKWNKRTYNLKFLNNQSQAASKQ